MRTVLFGKKIQNIYEVDHKCKEIKDDNEEVKTVYIDKPKVTRRQEIKEWTELCSYKGKPRYNSKGSSSNYCGWAVCHTVNISENESVMIENEIFRADLNEMHLYTSKIIEEIDVNKEDSLFVCEEQIKAFNKMMIESNNKLMSYCDLHKLSYKDTDCIELFKLVFPDKEYVIVDGIMKVKDKSKVCNNYGSVYIGDNSCITAATISTLSTNDLSNSISNAISVSCK